MSVKEWRTVTRRQSGVFWEPSKVFVVDAGFAPEAFGLENQQDEDGRGTITLPVTFDFQQSVVNQLVLMSLETIWHIS